MEGLSGVKVAAAAICDNHSLVADADGVVWAFGESAALGLSDEDAPPWGRVRQPTAVPNLRVRIPPPP